MPECPHYDKVVPLAQSNPDRIGKVFVEYPIIEIEENLQLLDSMKNFNFGNMNELLRTVFTEEMVIRGIKNRLFGLGYEEKDTTRIDIYKILNITCPDAHNLMLSIGECDPIYRRPNGRPDVRRVMMDMDLYLAYSSRGKGCRVAQLMNSLGEEMRYNLGIKDEKVKREFNCTYGFAASVDVTMTDLDNDRKPDIALVNAGGPTMGEKFTWSEIHVPIVWFNDRYAHEKAYRQLLGFAQKMFVVQPRRFVPGIAILDKHIMLYVFDRAGVYGSTQYRIAEDALQYVVASLLFVDDVDLGYDKSVDYQKDEGRVFVNGKDYQVKGVIFDTWQILGHGTVIRYVERDGQTYVNKDVWVHRSHEQEEQHILKRIKGVKNVVQLVDHEQLKVREGVLDSTEGRWKDVRNTEFLEKKKWKCKIMDHHQFILTPFGQPLNTFTSLIELVSALRDVAHTIRELMKIGIYHADVSHKNIVLVPDPDPAVKLRRGYLIDFGHSIDRHKCSGIKPRGQFFNMALDVLWAGSRSDYVDHRAFTDLESLFYVLIWECVMHRGPDRDYISEEEIKKTMIQRWKGDNCTEGDPWLYCFQQKAKDVAEAYDFETKVIPHFQPFFHDIIPLATELRDVIHVPMYTEKQREVLYERLDELQWELSERIRIGRIRTLAEDVKEQQKICDDSIPFVDREEEVVDAIIDVWDKWLRKLYRAELRERLENPRPKVAHNPDGTRAPLDDDYEEEVDIPDDISQNSTPEPSESEDDYYDQFHVDTDIDDNEDLNIGRAIMYDDEYYLANLTLNPEPPYDTSGFLRASDIRRATELRNLPKRKGRRDFFDRFPTKNPAPPGDKYREERVVRLKAKLKRRREREAEARRKEAEAKEAEEKEAEAKKEAEAEAQREAAEQKLAEAQREAEARRVAEASSTDSTAPAKSALAEPVPTTLPTPANGDLKRKRGDSEEGDSGYDSTTDKILENAKRQKTDAESEAPATEVSR